MADRKVSVPVDAETRTGGELGNGLQGTFYIEADAVANKGSVLALDGVSAAGAVTTWYYFSTSAGVLRRSSTFPTNTETDGTAV